MQPNHSPLTTTQAGFINSLAFVQGGEALIAGVGQVSHARCCRCGLTVLQEHRLGRWSKTPCKNGTRIIPLQRSSAMVSGSEDGDSEDDE